MLGFRLRYYLHHLQNPSAGDFHCGLCISGLNILESQIASHSSLWIGYIVLNLY